MLKIPKIIYEEMVSHARKAFPLECCGLLAGKDGKITRHYPMTNTDQSKISYLMDPREQFQVFKEIRGLGIDLLGIYHSHPKHPAYPSQTDVRLAFYPDATYYILSIQDQEQDPEMRGFRIVQEVIEEVPYSITEE